METYALLNGGEKRIGKPTPIRVSKRQLIPPVQIRLDGARILDIVRTWIIVAPPYVLDHIFELDYRFNKEGFRSKEMNQWSTFIRCP